MTISPQARPADHQLLRDTLIGNPAAVYCADVMAYEYRVVTGTAGEQNGICVLPDARECDQWDFYAGLCGQDYNYCARQGHGTETRMDGRDPFAARYAVCISSRAQMLGSVAQLSGLEALAAGKQAEARGGVEANTPLPALASAVPIPDTPSSFDWRDYQGADWLTGVKNQGNCGSCWAFAAVSVAEADHNIASGNPDLDLNLAEQELVSCSGAGSCAGGTSSSALDYIRTHGMVDEDCLPYTESNSSCSRCSDWQDRLAYVDQVDTFFPERSAMRQNVISDGPVSLFMGIGSIFGGYWDDTGIYRCSNDSQNDHFGFNHVVVIVGYDDAGSYWIVRNSWGSNWNGNGYFHLGYGECNVETATADYTYLVPPTRAADVRPSGWTGPYTKAPSPSFAWTAGSDSGSGLAGYYAAVDDWTPDGDSDHDWWVGNATDLTVPVALADGAHIFAVTSRDRFGNVNPPDTDQQGDAPYYAFYVDRTAPSSAVIALPAEQRQIQFVVDWSGNDATSGIADYDVQYRFDADGSWIAWISVSSATSAVFRAEREGMYCFRSRACDRAGNLESWPSGDGDTCTYVRFSKAYLPRMFKYHAAANPAAGLDSQVGRSAMGLEPRRATEH